MYSFFVYLVSTYYVLGTVYFSSPKTGQRRMTIPAYQSEGLTSNLDGMETCIKPLFEEQGSLLVRTCVPGMESRESGNVDGIMPPTHR